MQATNLQTRSFSNSVPLAPAAETVSARLTGTPLIWDSYALRYQVYCEQRSYLAAEHYPSGYEQDHFDEHAEHFGVYTDDFAEMVGTVRLVLGTRGPLPVVQHCPYPVVVEDPAGDDVKVAEISRLAVSKAAMGNTNNREVVRSLYRELYHASRQHGITHLLAAMEKTLARLVARAFNLQFEPIGPEFDYAGPVRPYLLKIETVPNTAPELTRPVPNRYPGPFPVRALQY